MKQTIGIPAKKAVGKLAFLIASVLLSVCSFAQDKKIDVNINTKPENGSNFFMQPWVWIVAGAIFILLLVALLRSGRSKD